MLETEDAPTALALLASREHHMAITAPAAQEQEVQLPGPHSTRSPRPSESGPGWVTLAVTKANERRRRDTQGAVFEVRTASASLETSQVSSEGSLSVRDEGWHRPKAAGTQSTPRSRNGPWLHVHSGGEGHWAVLGARRLSLRGP